MPCRSVSISATSASGFVGSAAGAPRSASLGLMSLTFGGSLPVTDPGGSPAAARQFGATTGFGGSWVGVPVAPAAGTLSGPAGAVDVGVGSVDAAALGGSVACGVAGADVVGPGVGAPCAVAAAGPAVAFGAEGALAPRSPPSRAAAPWPGAPVAISHTDILPSVKPTVMP